MLTLDPVLPTVPPRAADSFDANARSMAGRVSYLMARHPNLDAFLNGLPFRLIESNHRNHPAFMSEVLRTNNLDLLMATLPRVYYAYANQGLSVDYFAADLAIWVQVIGEILPEEDVEAILPIYRWILRVQPETVDAAAHYRSEPALVSADHAAVYAEILERLIAGDHPAVIERCRSLLQGGMTFSHLLQSIFYPEMVEIGVGWEQGRLSVAMEHQATAMVYRILSALADCEAAVVWARTLEESYCRVFSAAGARSCWTSSRVCPIARPLHVSSRPPDQSRQSTFLHGATGGRDCAGAHRGCAAVAHHDGWGAQTICCIGRRAADAIRSSSKRPLPCPIAPETGRIGDKVAVMDGAGVLRVVNFTG
ncbi:B12-binding domain-containing protein [Thiocapsa sp.]|uniref:B12-binding domain-containing protein n=1 Tax=Thiocapsa sp. TaxID=2024551 RepID=UPI002CA46133|nr:B12-binding domain-containing protein [Thiocapsa sp.]HSO81070.1 B12-binding domain-containing protein [Thiocapsa sp.]